MNTKLIWVAVIIVLAVAICAYFFPQVRSAFGANSPAGASFTDAKSAGQQVNTATDTVFSMLNSDASDRIIKATDVYLAGSSATTSNYLINCATSTVANGLSGNTNYILAQNLSAGLGTTTNSGLFFSSTSPGLSGANVAASTTARVWPAGTYLVCKAKDTASANSLNTFPTGTTGTFNFPYLPQ